MRLPAYKQGDTVRLLPENLIGQVLSVGHPDDPDLAHYYVVDTGEHGTTIAREDELSPP